MAYDRYDTRGAPRDERSRWRDDDRSSNRDWRSEGRSERGGNERGFFERAGDEIASWFGDEDAERRRHQDQSRDDPRGSSGSNERDYRRSPDQGRDRGAMFGRDDERDWGRHRPTGNRQYERETTDRQWERGQSRGYSTSERDYNPSGRSELGGRDRHRDEQRGGGGYRPMTGDYGRSSNRGERGFGDWSRDDDGQSEWGRDPYRTTSRAGTSDWTDRSRHEDPNYHSWRSRHLSELDRDYDDYRREHQSKFEDDFTNWRERRQQKRGLLGQIREHMEVVGSDDQHVGTVDKVAGDRIILTKSDPESGGAHHSLSCSDIDKIDGERIKLECSAEQAKQRWRDESRGRALFERDDQGEMGPRSLDRSFSGTYR